MTAREATDETLSGYPDNILVKIISQLDIAQSSGSTELSDSIKDLVSQCPRVTTRRWLELQSEAFKTSPGYVRLCAYVSNLNDGALSWPWGAGPLEQIFAGLDRAYGLDAAKSLARLSIVTASLSTAYVAAACNVTSELSVTQDVEQAFRLHQVMLAAVEPDGVEDENDVRVIVWLSWLEVAGKLFKNIRDQRAYDLACGVDAALTRISQAIGDERLAADIDFAFAHFLIHPFLMLSSSVEEFESARRRWAARGQEREPTSADPEATGKIPDANEALQIAEVRLHRSLQYYTDTDTDNAKLPYVRLLLGRVLLCEAVLQGWEPSNDRVLEAASHLRQAADKMPSVDLPNRLEALGLLIGLSQHVTPEELGVLPPVDDLSQRYGPLESGRIILNAAHVLGATDQDLALPLLAAYRQSIRGLEERTRGEIMLVYVRMLFGGRISKKAAEITAQLHESVSGSQLYAAVRERIVEDGWSLTEFARVLCAVLDSENLQPEDGLRLAEYAYSLVPCFKDVHWDAVRFHAASLATRLANRALQIRYNTDPKSFGVLDPIGDRELFIQLTCEALSRFADLGFADGALESVQILQTLLDLGLKDVASVIVREMLPRAAALEVLAGARAYAAIAQLLQSCIGRFVNKESETWEATDTTTFLEALHLAKGHALSMALVAGAAYDPANDPDAVALLRKVRDQEQQLGDTTLADTRLDEIRLVAPYVGLQEDRPETTARDVLRGLQHSYDDLVYRKMLSTAPRRMPSAADVISALPNDAVLLILYSMQSAGKPYLLGTVVTNERVSTGGQALHHDASRYSLDPTLPHLNQLGIATLMVRLEIQHDPGSDLVAPAAGRTLSDWSTWALGPTAEVLDELKGKGYRRLIIVPDGPLHVFPFHLLGLTERPLCTDWLVSYLPTPFAPAVSSFGRHRHRRLGVVAFGIDFIDYPGPAYLELPEAVAEAQAVAASVRQGRAETNAKATKRAVAEALEGARWVHIATHGECNPSAPAFNSLLLWPESGKDGRLETHELLSLNLQGLDLVTLSACETSLGRYDAADNLRSIPSTLLLLGAKAVISTLWPVETMSSVAFFTSLYQKLGEGDPVEEAFASAQQLTRAGFPAYRDWGAFTLMGC